MALQFHKYFYFTYFVMIFKLIFCSKRMKAIKVIKSPLSFEVIPLSNADRLFTAR